MVTLESLLFWLGVSLYGLSGISFALGTIFGREGLSKAAFSLAISALLPHGISLIIRWIEAGHAPYLTRYEVFSSNAWVAAAAFLTVSAILPRIRQTGIMFMPLVFLMMGFGVLSSKEMVSIPLTFQSYWLILHITFAKLAFTSILVAFSLAVVYLWRSRKGSPIEPKAGNTLSSDLEDLSYKFTALGFIFLSIMITTGSLWAYKAWGRYWAWDPTETWSLITWLVYGIYLHLRRVMSWRGIKAAWLVILCLVITVVTLFGLPTLTETIHSEYFSK